MVAIPRIGQEVVIQFEEGNPDRPICTGMLYNADTMPPYTLPDNMTMMGIKTNKTKGGGGFNEFVMEDKAEEEYVRLQSERDYVEIIKNNAEITIGMEHQDAGDLTQTIHHDKTETIKTGDHTFTVEKGNQTIGIKVNKEETIEGKSDLTITGNLTEKVTTGNIKRSAKAGKIEVDAAISIELKCGGSSIMMTPASITIKSVMISLEACFGAFSTVGLAGSCAAGSGRVACSVTSATAASVAGFGAATVSTRGAARSAPSVRASLSGCLCPALLRAETGATGATSTAPTSLVVG